MSVLRIPSLKLVVVGLGVYFLVIGSVCMLMPQPMAEQFSISTIEVHGLSTVRGDLGGLFLGLAIMSFLGVKRPMMLYAASILLGAIALGRVFGFILDGVTYFTVMLCVVEVILAGIFIGLAIRTQVSLNGTATKSAPNESTESQ